jgi:hypothetical protein
MMLIVRSKKSSRQSLAFETKKRIANPETLVLMGVYQTYTVL